MNRPILLSALLLAALPAAANETASAAPSREHFAPPGMEASYHVMHYTPVVKAGDLVIVSGIPAGHGDTYEDKVRNMFRALERHLATSGATLGDVVELTSFHVGATDAEAFNAEFARFAPIHEEFFPDHYPAWTAVGTTALLQPGAPVELRAMAVIGSGKSPRAAIPPPAPRRAPPAQAQAND
ncbi:Rid family hydrolase [Arenimonas sp.]|uniref:Rid family hydrolase n=1 Tax=Arenimonas sp. TaxID=1872635 RepID=UPI002E35134A|nr:Rid family hydrolase [Arenimonas sp.]HEX4853981.1 Rid family hydrolase [Arenimonas sp.]